MFSSGMVRRYPLIADRLHLLVGIDSTLQQGQFVTPSQILYCPLCSGVMNDFIGKSHYRSSVHLDVCIQCGSVWCDKLELYLISDLVDLPTLSVRCDVKSEYFCPFCHVVLSSTHYPDSPVKISTWHCSCCRGDFLEQNMIQSFIEYRHFIINRNRKEPFI